MKQSEIERLLPAVIGRTAREGNPLHTLLAVMEMLHDPSERVLDDLDSYFDPLRAPDAFIPYLAGWVDLDRLLVANPAELREKAPPPFPTGVGRLRELVAAAAFLAKWRGTATGLLRSLEIATGIQGFSVVENPPGPALQAQPFHIRVHMPTEAAAYEILIRRIIEMEKPAYVTYDLHVEQAG
ncbi:MAG: phage tail protein [Chloroflexota bacterium]|nr:phage tail protein [Chloroflexota bacterium]